VSPEPVAKHHLSHRTLLRPPPEHGGGAVDAIVMPAARPAANLLPAMEVAAELGCQFVALCSGRTRVEEAAGLAAEVPGLRRTLIRIPDGWSSPLVEFGTADIREATDTRVGDLSLKRNLGLLLAQLVGWRGVLFLDDDIRDLSPRTVLRAAGALRPGWATGMIAEDFPDNSVVCHALRLSGQPQEVFVSGSALAVDTTTVDSFFPEIYNEDWLFAFDRVRGGRVSPSGVVRQAPYRPFANPGRAAREEFGDLLAEGLMSLLHARTTMKRALNEGYWEQAIAARHGLLDGITRRLSETGGPDSAVTAVAAARDMLRSFDGEVLAMYVRRWREDVREWTKRVQLLPRTCSVEAAVERLGLPTAGEWSSAPQGTARVKRSSNRVGSWLSALRSPVLTNPSLR
jgi:hypothetical protein